mmetsp:Transcript_10684/g.10557  ORF Transcript_10684/g.10557 Transcript_10684/m.10557 type:complete len:133 (+) Transcript_10684:858-1256(+)
MNVDGDYASTDDSAEESEPELQDEHKSSPDEQKSSSEEKPQENTDIPEFTNSELALIRKVILNVLSHKNNRGDTILIEAVKQNRQDLLDSIRVTNLVRPDPEKEREVSLGYFFDRYDEITEKIENRRRRRRC